MLTRAVRLTSIRGIDVRLDPSLIVLALLLGWLLHGQFAVNHGRGTAVAMAGIASLLFFLSILAHEVAHALEALHRGIEVESITLLLFGGVTQMHTESRRPRDEFVIAAVGPYVSLVCAAVFGLVAALGDALLPIGPATAVIELSRLLALVNLALAVFNLVPGAPLDGGRVLRAGLWWLFDDRSKAIRVAARAGIAFALLLLGFGVWALLQDRPGSLTTGAWWLVIGVFLFGAARVELRHGHVQDLLRGHTVADLVATGSITVPADRRADLLVDLEVPRHDLVLVTADDGSVLGWLEPGDLAALHPADRAIRSAGDLLHPASKAPPIGADAPLRSLIDRFVRGEHDRLRVEDGGRTVAVLSEARVARALDHLRRTGGLPGGSDEVTAAGTHP